MEEENKLVVYLGGPINDCTDEECIDWRQQVMNDLGDKYEFLDPIRRDYRGREHEEELYIQIVEDDKQDILNTDVVVINALKPSVGTSMECLFAWENGIPVIIRIDEPKYISPWFRYHSKYIVKTFDEVYELLNSYQTELLRINDVWNNVGAEMGDTL